MWLRWKTNFNQVLRDPSPTHLHPTQKSNQPLFHRDWYTQSLGSTPCPELVGAVALDSVGVVSRGGLGGLPRGELCLHDTVCQSDFLWLHHSLVIGTLALPLRFYKESFLRAL